MRFLSINNLQLGGSPGGVPAHVVADSRAFSTRAAWQRAVALAIKEQVHAVVLSGEVLSSTNAGFEPWGPLVDGLAELHRVEIPVIGLPNGEFNSANLNRFAPESQIHWLHHRLEWDPVFTTSIEPQQSASVHIVAGSLAEQADAPVENPITLDQTDHPNSIWILTRSNQPDQFVTENTMVIEPGSIAPLSPRDTGRHGAWLVDTDVRDAQFFPLATIEFAALDIDISAADDLENIERIITSSLAQQVDASRNDGSIAETLLADITLTGSSRLFAALADTANELQRTMMLEHDGMTVAISNVEIDATPNIDLEPLLNRPDPVGEFARLVNALESGEELTEAQSRLITAAEQKLLSISHARVFGSILDMQPEADAATLLRRQGWATLDALVRQRGID